MPSKIIFLDIDGVLNTVASELGWRDLFHHQDDFKKGDNVKMLLAGSFCRSSLYNMYDLIKCTGAKVVISSTWRHGMELDGMKAWFPHKIAEHVIDKTPAIL